MNKILSFQDGYYVGILRWPELDALWLRLSEANPKEESWYFYQVGNPLPDSPLTQDKLKETLTELDQLLHRDHSYDYCGIVYADDRQNPTFIKIYDPNNLGSSCGCSGNRIPPRWILSQSKPELVKDDAPIPNNRQRWWKKLFSRD